MKKEKQGLSSKMELPNVIAKCAFAFSVVGANSKCCYIFHQPEKPDMRKLRKF